MQPSTQVDEFNTIMKRLPLVADSLDFSGLYILDDGFRFVLWFGRMLSPDIAMNLLGQDFASELSKVCYVILGICGEYCLELVSILFLKSVFWI